MVGGGQQLMAGNNQPTQAVASTQSTSPATDPSLTTYRNRFTGQPMSLDEVMALINGG
jgi:hypothetical protein